MVVSAEGTLGLDLSFGSARSLERRLKGTRAEDEALISVGRDGCNRTLLFGASSTETRVLIRRAGVRESNQPTLKEMRLSVRLISVG